MNNIDRFFSRDPVAFAKDYIGYLKTILQGIDASQIAGFIEMLLDARERGEMAAS